MYTKSDVLDYVEMEDVKFIRLAFCDVFGKQRNISVLSSELGRAFDTGISIDASAIRGFTDEAHSRSASAPRPLHSDSYSVAPDALQSCENVLRYYISRRNTL